MQSLFSQLTDKTAKASIGLMVLLYSSSLFAEETVSVAAKSVVQSPAEQILKMVVGLIIVLIMIFVIAWLARNHLGFTPATNSALKPIAGVAVGQKERVVLLQVSDRQILVGVSPGSVNMLYVLDKESEVKTDPQESKNLFAEKLKASLGKWEKS